MSLENGAWMSWSHGSLAKSKSQLVPSSALVKISSVLREEKKKTSKQLIDTQLADLFTFQPWPALTCFIQPGPNPARGGVLGNVVVRTQEDLLLLVMGAAGSPELRSSPRSFSPLPREACLLWEEDPGK